MAKKKEPNTYTLNGKEYIVSEDMGIGQGGKLEIFFSDLVENIELSELAGVFKNILMGNSKPESKAKFCSIVLQEKDKEWNEESSIAIEKFILSAKANEFNYKTYIGVVNDFFTLHGYFLTQLPNLLINIVMDTTKNLNIK